MELVRRVDGRARRERRDVLFGAEIVKHLVRGMQTVKIVMNMTIIMIVIAVAAVTSVVNARA